ncbi:ABC transporter substrate-binding protein [bacterium]|nr:ABC transporter substrate-binding protein [bacterium]
MPQRFPFFSRRTLGYSLFFFACIALIASCFQRPEPPLRVGVTPWPGNAPYFLARDLGYYGKSAIRLVEYPSIPELFRAFQNHAIEAASMTSYEVILLAGKRQNPHVVLIQDFSHGADAILGQPGIARMRDLKGRRVGVEVDALGIYVLSRALELSGMSPQDVKLVPLPLYRHESAFLGRQVDAVVTFEPKRSRLLAAGARELFNSTQIPGEIADCLVVREPAFKAHPQALETLVGAWFQTGRFIWSQPQAAIRMMAPGQGQTPQQFSAALRGVTFPDQSENRRLLGDPNGAFAKALNRLAKVMNRHGLVAGEVDSDVVLDDRLVRRNGP